MAGRVSVKERLPEVRSAKHGEPLDPNNHTYWTLDKKKNIRARQQKGYRMAKEEEVAELHDGYLDVDGNIRNGDLVLMIGPVEVEQRKEAARHELDRRLEQAGQTAAQKEADGAIYESGENTQTYGGKVHKIS